MGSYDKKITEGAKPFLADGEEVLASFIARPRGWTQANAGVRGLGNKQMAAAEGGAAAGGFELASPMALALTNRRLLSIKIGSPIGLGIGGAVKEIAGEAPLDAVDSIEVKRMGLAQITEVTVRGSTFKLEANAKAECKALAEKFEQARATAPA
jgi:hypothetical protein